MWAGIVIIPKISITLYGSIVGLTYERYSTMCPLCGHYSTYPFCYNLVVISVLLLMVTDIGVAGILALKKLATSKLEGAFIEIHERRISLVSVMFCLDNCIGT